MFKSLKHRLLIYLTGLLILILYFLISKTAPNPEKYYFRNNVVHIFMDETKLDNGRVNNILKCWLKLQSDNFEVWIWRYNDILSVLDMTLQQYRGIFKGLSKTRAMYLIPLYLTQIFGGYFGFFSQNDTYLPIFHKYRKDTCYLFLPPSFFISETLFKDNDYKFFSIYCSQSHPFLRLHNQMIVLTRNKGNLHDAVGWNVLKHSLSLAGNLKEYKINPISVQSSRYLASQPNKILERCRNSTSTKVVSIFYANDKLKVDRIKEYLGHM